jgi:hypothetical protein
MTLVIVRLDIDRNTVDFDHAVVIRGHLKVSVNPLWRAVGLTFQDSRMGLMLAGM